MKNGVGTLTLLLLTHSSALKLPSRNHAFTFSPSNIGTVLNDYKASAFSILISGLMLASTPAIGDTAVAGFEEFAAKGGTMKTDPNCFFNARFYIVDFRYLCH